MMKLDSWRRPHPEESERGILAVNIAYHSLTDKKGKTRHYEQECPYTLQMIERRSDRGDDLPAFIERIGTNERRKAH